MSVFYKVLPIKGKGLGCIAIKDIKKGTLILQEKPQCKSNPNAENGSQEEFQSVIKSFHRMSDENKEKFMGLYDRYESINVEDDLPDWDFGNMELLKIYQIFKSNSFEMGVGIQASRFNHSCSSNAEAFWNDENETREVRAVSKIKVGEEITVNYIWKQLSMKNVQLRHSITKSEVWEYLILGASSCKRTTFFV